jgi:polyketide cyclase/dehydrase/lipid transport protein
MYLAALQPWEPRLISTVITVALGAVAYFVLQRARNAQAGAKNVTQVKHAGEAMAAVPVAVYGLTIVAMVVAGVLLRLPWWTAAFILPVLAWSAWWLPVRRRRVVSEASIVVNGLPARVSAFVADVPRQAKWSPGAVSYTPEMQGPRGPRFSGVERMPDGREIAGVIELTRDDPGVEVDILLAGTGASGDYYSFAPKDGGTLVTKRSLFEMPYILALAGGMFALRGDPTGAHQRRINELNALKLAFESGQ